MNPAPTLTRRRLLKLGLGGSLVLGGVGLLAGILSGLVGVGGGAVIVPGLELVVGVGDLMARGTSLLVMIPTAIAGTRSNARHGVVDEHHERDVAERAGVSTAAISQALNDLGNLRPETRERIIALGRHARVVDLNGYADLRQAVGDQAMPVLLGRFQAQLRDWSVRGEPAALAAQALRRAGAARVAVIAERVKRPMSSDNRLPSVTSVKCSRYSSSWSRVMGKPPLAKALDYSA